MDTEPSTELEESSSQEEGPQEINNQQQNEPSNGEQSLEGQTESTQVMEAPVESNQTIEQPVEGNATSQTQEKSGEQLPEQHVEVGQAGDPAQTDAQTDNGNKDWPIEVNRTPATNDQEMGLAVAILELIGSQPHIVINNPTGSDVADQQGDNQGTVEYVDIPVKDVSQQQIEQGDATQSSDVSPEEQQDPYPVTLHVIDEPIEVSPEAAAAAATAATAAAAAADVEGIEEPSGQGESNGNNEQVEESVTGKRKRGRPKKVKKKGADDEEKDKQDEPSKKKKKSDKKKDDVASTSSDTPNKEKKVSAPKNFICEICSAAFNRKDNLKVHTRTKHNSEILDAGTSKTKCLNPQCDRTFYHKTQMLRHMEEEHGLEVQKKEIEFKSLDEFKKWKVEEETRKYVFFSSYRGPAANKNGKDSHLYFKCQKDGPNRPHRKLGEPGRKTERRNRKGSVKTGLLCPARMICKVCGKTGKVTLTYIYSHSHTITCSDTEHQPVPTPLKKELMEKLALGTPVKQLYRDLRKVSAEQGGGKAASHSGVEAVHYVSHRTLELMKHRVDMSRRLHHEESTSILLLVEQLKTKPYNPILLYKPQGGVAVVGDESLMHLPFADDLSVLALQTEEQMKVLQQGMAKVIYVDTTHANNATDQKLISLVMPDSYQQGYAVAHLIANRIDEHLLYYFIKAIKERCEGLEPTVIMTDEENTGYGVFQAVFPGVTFTHYLSKWHVHRSWLKRMNRDIPNVSLRQEMYHCLVLMMEEPNVNKFNEMASNFVSHYATKSQTFTEYFVELYRARTELWAMCFRNHPDGKTDDVIFMSNYHSNLKAFFGQKRKSSKRIDSLVHILLDLDRDDSWKRVKKAFQDGGNDPETGPSLSHHEKGMLIPEAWVEEVGEQDTSWYVMSNDQKGIKHQVKKLIHVCVDDNCYLKCLELPCFSLCHHLYECSCFDEVSICQHVHRVHSIRVAQLQAPQSLQCVTPAADLGAYVEIHYMDDDEAVGVATQNIQTSEVVPAATEAPSDSAVPGGAQVGTLQSRLQHLVNLLGSRQVDDILLNHVTGTVDQLISTCEAANNVPATQS